MAAIRAPKLDSEGLPLPGQWPSGVQESLPIDDGRIWIDGCFDFTHHGHAGAMLQARKLGRELLVGVHSDEAILENKGPTVMTLEERILAVESCRWATMSIPHAPYVTTLPWISHYGCKYVVHGDDITSDSSGEDCYRFVKAANRFLVVKRTPGISTTDLVGRMLLCTKGHFLKSLEDAINSSSTLPSNFVYPESPEDMRTRIRDYATDETGLAPGVEVWSFSTQSGFTKTVPGNAPLPGQRIVYVDGGFDLFSSGHIEFLRMVHKKERVLAEAAGWYSESAMKQRIEKTGQDYGPAYVVAGVHDDETINREKGLNYPIMNIFERGLLVLQCKYIHAMVFGAPFIPTQSYFETQPYSTPHVVYHGPTAFMPTSEDPYADAKRLGIFQEVENHAFQNVNAEEIVQRIMKSRALYEERQRRKGAKAVNEEEARRLEMEAQANTATRS